MFIDFKEVKRLVSIERAMVYLSLKGLKAENHTYRGECPRCKEGGSRALVITPAENVFFCHAARKGGDVISLVAHLHGTSMKEAASWLLDQSSKSTKPAEKKATVPQKNDERTKDTFQPLAHLQYDHQLVADLGIAVEDAERLGVGYASRGLLKGHVCIPVRLTDGSLAGYVGIQAGKVPKEWHYPNTNVVPLKRRA